MNHLIKILILSSFMQAIALVTEAQGISDSIFSIEELEVRSGFPLQEKALNKTTLDLSLIKAGDFDDISNLLSQRSPLFINSYGPGSLTFVSFRGMAASHTRVEWNGIYLNNPMAGQVDFSLLPLFFADEISLIYGGSSLFEGSGALGGTVILKTIPIWGDTLGVSLLQKSGSFSTSNSALDIRGGTDSFQSRTRIFRTKSKNDFPFKNNLNGDWDTQTQENAEYLKSGIQQELHFRSANDHVFSLSTWFQKADRHFPTIMSYEGEGRDENQQDMDFRSSLQWKKYGYRFNTESLLGVNISDVEYFARQKSLDGNVILFDTENSFSSVIARNKTEFKLKEGLMFRNLIDYIHHEVRSNDRQSTAGYENQRTSVGNTFSLHARISEKLSGYSLLRAEFSDGKFIPLMPSIGIEITPFQNRSILFMGNLSRNYHLPGLNDLYWIPGGNINLKPEKGYSSDLSVGYKEQIGNSLEIDSRLSLYYSLVEDWIIWIPGEYGFWTAGNIPKVASRGLEYQFSADYKPGIFRSTWFLNYSYTKATSLDNSYLNADNDGKQLIYIPVHKGNTFFRLSSRSNYLSYNLSYIGKRYTTTSNEESTSLPAYFLNGISLGRVFNVNKVSAEMNFKINNILGIDYKTIRERAMPGRNYQITLNLRF